MRGRIVINRPADPLAHLIAAREPMYRRKWRVPVSEVEEPADRAPAASSSDPDGFVQKIRGLLGVKQ